MLTMLPALGSHCIIVSGIWKAIVTWLLHHSAFSDLNGPSTCQRSLSCLSCHIRVTQCSLLTWVFMLFIFYLNNINLSNSEGPKPKHKYPAKINCHLDSRARPGRQWPLSYEHWTNNKWPSPLLTQEMWVKRKSGHLTPVSVVGSPSIALMRNSPSHLMPWSQECTHQTNTLLTIFT